MKLRGMIIIALIFLSGNYGLAQAREYNKWFPVLISIHGTVDHEGVEANAMITTCNKEDVMLLELKNTNPYKVKAQWLHAPITKDGKQHYKDDLQTIEIPGGYSVSGTCGGSKQLCIRLSDYDVKLEDLQDYYGSNFTVTKQ